VDGEWLAARWLVGRQIDPRRRDRDEHRVLLDTMRGDEVTWHDMTRHGVVITCSTMLLRKSITGTGRRMAPW
jgi:hypothetical protein